MVSIVVTARWPAQHTMQTLTVTVQVSHDDVRVSYSKVKVNSSVVQYPDHRPISYRWNKGKFFMVK